MAKEIKAYRLFLAMPGDIQDESQAIEAIVQEWNVQHGMHLGTHVQMTSWKTHAFPATGDRPQALINQQVVDDSDIVVGVFWSRFGSPTGAADSGTEEEIRSSIKAGKHVMVYFSDRPLNPSKLDFSQYQKIEQFKKDFADSGLYWTYSDISQFGQLFRQHLAAVMNGLLQVGGKPEEVLAEETLEKEISIELTSRYWVLILALLEEQVSRIGTHIETLKQNGRKPEELHESETLAIIGPLFARSKIVDVLVDQGVMTQKAKDELGVEAIIKKFNLK